MDRSVFPSSFPSVMNNAAMQILEHMSWRRVKVQQDNVFKELELSGQNF